MPSVNLLFYLKNMKTTMEVGIYSTPENSVEYITQLYDSVMSHWPKDFEAMRALMTAKHKGRPPLEMRVVSRIMPYYVDTSETSYSALQNAVTTASEETLPLIIVPKPADYIMATEEIERQQLVINKEAVLRSVGISVLLPTIEDHEKMTKILRENNINFYTSFDLFPLHKHKWSLHIVIREVPKEIDVEDIKADLLAQNYPVSEVYRMRNQKKKKIHDMVAVTVDNTKRGRKIFGLKRVMFFDVPPVTEWRGPHLGSRHDVHFSI